MQSRFHGDWSPITNLEIQEVLAINVISIICSVIFVALFFLFSSAIYVIDESKGTNAGAFGPGYVGPLATKFSWHFGKYWESQDREHFQTGSAFCFTRFI